MICPRYKMAGNRGECKVLFVCTANTVETIPQPLLDRMEVIHLSGYFQDEKMQIAKKYLLPKIQVETGLKNVK